VKEDHDCIYRVLDMGSFGFIARYIGLEHGQPGRTGVGQGVGVFFDGSVPFVVGYPHGLGMDLVSALG